MLPELNHRVEVHLLDLQHPLGEGGDAEQQVGRRAYTGDVSAPAPRDEAPGELSPSASPKPSD